MRGAELRHLTAATTTECPISPPRIEPFDDLFYGWIAAKLSHHRGQLEFIDGGCQHGGRFIFQLTRRFGPHQPSGRVGLRTTHRVARGYDGSTAPTDPA
jgi:hypothetical protein